MATITEIKVMEIGQSEALVMGLYTGDASYPTGGEAIDAPGDLGYHDLWITNNTTAYAPVWDKANQKLKFYSGGSEVANATDLSAVTSLRYCAIRPA